MIHLLLIATLAFSSTEKAEKLVKDFEETKKNLVEEELKQRTVMSSLFEINRKMKKIVTERGTLEQERLSLESTTKDLATRLLELEGKLKIQKALMRERLSAIYKLGGQGIARILFSSTSSSQLERNLKILGIVAKKDLELIKDYSKTTIELENKRKKFTKRLANLRKVEEDIKSKEQKLSVQNQNKSKILNEIRKSKKFNLTKLSGLRSKTLKLASNDDSGMLDLLFRPIFFEQKGKLPPPVKGKVAKGFGLIHDREFNLSLSHKGIQYEHEIGSPIHAIFDGTVVYVGYVTGFGNTLILDHGDHYYSVYSKGNNFALSVGDTIKQNQIIGTSDSLYFEIRHFSEPYNPQLWMKGITL